MIAEEKINNEAVITMIYPSNIAQLWPEVEPLLLEAVEHSGTHTAEDVYKSIMGGKSQLWVQWSGKVDAAVTTEFVDYPKGLWFRFWLAGALKGSEILWQKLFYALYDYAEKNNCVGIEDCGRDGWDKYIPEGYNVSKAASLRRIKIGN